MKAGEQPLLRSRYDSRSWPFVKLPYGRSFMVAMTVCNRLAPVAAVGYGRPARRHGASGQTSVSREPSGRGGRTSGPEQSWLIAPPLSVG